jgi:23S rRNA pseudouridine2605 synthase
VRLNRYVAAGSSLSRRAADEAIEAGRVRVNGEPGQLGMLVKQADQVTLDSRILTLPLERQYVMLNKPVGYVTSRARQGSTPTIYQLLPHQYHLLQPVGRLDKDSSGLLLLTDDGDWAQRLSHPSFSKRKVYQLTLDRPITAADAARLEAGVELDDGLSQVTVLSRAGADITVALSEGRNRQLRRTFEALGYQVRRLHRTDFGPYQLGDLPMGEVAAVAAEAA